MYSEEMRREAVDLWFALYPSISMDDFVAELGYPSRACLAGWIREDPRFDPDKPRHDSRPLLSKLEALRRVADGEGYAAAGRACGMSGYHVRWLAARYAEGGASALLPAPRKRRTAVKKEKEGAARPPGTPRWTSPTTCPTTRPPSSR